MVAARSEPALTDPGILHPHAARPARGGLVPWGQTCQGDVFFRLPCRPGPEAWPILASEEDSAAWHSFGMTVPEFVLQVVSPGGTVDPGTMGSLVQPPFAPLDREP